MKYPLPIAVVVAALAPGLPLNGRALAAEPDHALRARVALALAAAAAPETDSPVLPTPRPRPRAAGCTCGPDCPCADRAHCGPAQCPLLPIPKRRMRPAPKKAAPVRRVQTVYYLPPVTGLAAPAPTFGCATTPIIGLNTIPMCGGFGGGIPMGGSFGGGMMGGMPMGGGFGGGACSGGT